MSTKRAKSNARPCQWQQLDTNMSDESDMTNKKRRTVTTIETHEVWIVRKVAPEVADEAQGHPPIEISPTVAVSTLSEVKESSQTNEDES